MLLFALPTPCQDATTSEPASMVNSPSICLRLSIDAAHCADTASSQAETAPLTGGHLESRRTDQRCSDQTENAGSS